MAYTAILNTEVDAESPITESLMTRLRDNPLAVAAADAAAPRVKCNAAAGNASAISSTATVGKVLRVSSTASPDGAGNLVVPEDLGGDGVLKLSRSSASTQELTDGARLTWALSSGTGDTPPTQSAGLITINKTGWYMVYFDLKLTNSANFGTSPLCSFSFRNSSSLQVFSAITVASTGSGDPYALPAYWLSGPPDRYSTDVNAAALGMPILLTSGETIEFICIDETGTTFFDSGTAIIQYLRDANAQP